MNWLIIVMVHGVFLTGIHLPEDATGQECRLMALKIMRAKPEAVVSCHLTQRKLT